MGKNYRITPEGTRDYIFEECTLRRELERRVSGLFSRRGFTEVVTPEVEFLDVFTLESHHISEESMYKLSDRKGRLIALRPDSTMPIARLVSTRLRDEEPPLRLYYNQKVYHAAPSLAGRSDEELQSGIEIIGVSGFRADLEAVSLAVETLESCDPQDFRLEIGHIALFNRLAEKYGIDDELKEEIRRLIEGKDFPALNDLVDSRLGSEAASQFKQLPRLFGGEEVFDQAIALFDDGEITRTIRYLQDLYSALGRLGLRENVSVDLGLVNRIDYYTGVLFRGYISGFGQAILSGGRYDNLLAEFGRCLPAIGFALNLDAVLVSLLESGAAVRDAAPALLVFSEAGYEAQGLVCLKKQVEKGLTAEYSLFGTLEEALEYAGKKGIPEVLVVSGETRTITL